MYMFKYVMKRLGLMFFTFVIIFTMCFALIKLLPIPTNVLPGQDPEIVMKTLEEEAGSPTFKKVKTAFILTTAFRYCFSTVTI